MLLLVACLLLLPLFCWDYVLGPCFVMQYLVSFLVLQSFGWEGELDAYTDCFPDVLWLLVFSESS